nr:reverse transcriptase domain-containing protein [Tanacetum cinerariifolium]
MASKITAQDLEIASLKARIKLLEDKDGGVAEPSGDDATIKGRSLEIGEETAIEKISVPPAVEVSIVSVPTGSAREDQRMNEQIARDAEIARMHAEEELQMMIDSLDRNNETIAKYLHTYEQFAVDLYIGERIELINDLVKYQDNYAKVLKYQSQQRKPLSKKQQREFYMSVLKSHSGWKAKHFKGMSLEEIKEKFILVWKQIEDFVPMAVSSLISKLLPLIVASSPDGSATPPFQFENQIPNSEPIVAPVEALVSGLKHNPKPSIPYLSRLHDQKLHDKANDAILKNMQTNMTSLTNSNLEIKNMFGQFMKMNTASSSGSRTLPSNTVTNPKEDLKGITTRSRNAYQGPMIPTTSSPPKVVERETEVTKDMPIVAPVEALVSGLKHNPKPSIPYPSRLHDQKLRDKVNDQKEKIFQIFQDLNFNISFVDALILMPKFGPTIKILLTNKEKLFELARTPLNEHCSAVLLKKLPEKLRDPGKFVIPCDF